MFGLVGGDFDAGLFEVRLLLPLVDWASLSTRESDLFPGLDLFVGGERPDFDGLENTPSDFEFSSGDLGLFGEPVVVFDWLIFPETKSFGLDGFFNCKPSLGSSDNLKKNMLLE